MADKKEYTREQFLDLLNRLCKETGYTIVAHPEWIRRDDNTFSMIIVQTIEKMTEK
jgi:hypothetical protein